MSRHLFTYGTLEFPEIFEAITGDEVRGIPASVENFARYLLKGKCYPGIVAVEGEVISGTLYLNVDPVAMQKIENYEDACYDKHRLKVVAANQREFEAMAFVIPETQRHLLSGRKWSQREFADKYLESFLRDIR